jgi:hypothetical protein
VLDFFNWATGDTDLPGDAMMAAALLGDDGSFRLSAKIGSQSFTYVRDENGRVTVTGTFRGKPAK